MLATILYRYLLYKFCLQLFNCFLPLLLNEFYRIVLNILILNGIIIFKCHSHPIYYTLNTALCQFF